MAMDHQDKVLVCRDCSKEFLFSAGEQAFYAEKGFQNEPTRCRNCRAARKGGGPSSVAGESPGERTAHHGFPIAAALVAGDGGHVIDPHRTGGHYRSRG